MAKRKVFEELKLALGDALAYEKGQRVDLRTTEIPSPTKKISPHQIKAIRLSLNASQPKLAMLLNVSVKTVQSWEQGVRQPSGADLKLLTIACKHPEVLLEV